MCRTFEAMTLGDTNDVDQLVLVEDGRDGHRLLQMLLCPVYLVWDAAPIKLNLHDVGLFLFYGKQPHLVTKENQTVTCNSI